MIEDVVGAIQEKLGTLGIPVYVDNPDAVKLPWRATGLDGFSTDQGPTFDGGWFTGGGPHSDRSVTVRLHTRHYRTTTVELDLSDRDSHGCSVTLTPDVARQVAAALVAGAEQAEADVAHWRGVLEQQRAELQKVLLRAMSLGGRASIRRPSLASRPDPEHVQDHDDRPGAGVADHHRATLGGLRTG